MVYIGSQASVFLKNTLSDSNVQPGRRAMAAGLENKVKSQLDGLKYEMINGKEVSAGQD